MEPKLYLDLKDDFKKNDIKSRDRFIHFLRYHNLLIRKTKLYHITTDSKHGFYKSKDLLADLEIKHAEQVFVSDITYIKLASQHAYLALVTDVYSKKIMGYKIDTNMRVKLVKD
jgi:transposase InsO family protein